MSISLLHQALSIGISSSSDRKWHPSPCDLPPAGGDILMGGASLGVKGVAFCPRAHQGFANRDQLGTSSSFRISHLLLFLDYGKQRIALLYLGKRREKTGQPST